MCQQALRKKRRSRIYNARALEISITTLGEEMQQPFLGLELPRRVSWKEIPTPSDFVKVVSTKFTSTSPSVFSLFPQLIPLQ